jgi:hypothetical protein
MHQPSRPMPRQAPSWSRLLRDGARVTQGKRLFTLREKYLRRKHHVGMMVKKSSNSAINPSYGTFKSDKCFNRYQVSHVYHKKISTESLFVI